jgi:bifunctional ADP-heptose synthase (sugar kinase/adenylyltransferase)
MQNAKAAVGNDGISVVGILTEKAVLEKKPNRPVLGFDERMLLAQAIRFNDFVIPQDTYSPVSNISFLHPDILMESQSHDTKDIGEAQRIMDEIGGRVITTPYYPMTSSSTIKDIIQRGKNE